MHRKFHECVVAVAGVIIAMVRFSICYTDFAIVRAPLVYYNTFFEKQSPYVHVNVSENRGELCKRECVHGDHRICYFDFYLEHYQAMGVACGKCALGVIDDCNHPQCVAADGVGKGVMSINRQIPGPPIHVCKDDLIIVDVHNMALGTAAAIHWHGIHMQQSPHMDGVPFLTQCPISYSNTFRYHFYAANEGTQFYHSHSGHHKANGQFGALIVRKPREAYSYVRYDFDLPEHYILLNDWMHEYAEQHFPGLTSAAPLPDSVLINGRGLFTDPKTREQIHAPPTIYYVEPGFRYRFRIINSGNHVCPIQVQIENHELTVISSDSFDILPYSTDTLVTNSGERYDIIVDANNINADHFIRVRALGFCRSNLIESFAILRYRAAWIDSDVPILPFPLYEETFPSKTYLNHPSAMCSSEGNSHCITDVISIEKDFELQKAIPHYKFFLGFQNYMVPNREVFASGEYNHFTNLGSNLTVMGTINRISSVFPDYPLLTQSELIEESQFCNANKMPAKCDGKTVCTCIHLLKVALNSIVELVIVDETKAGAISHPFHLHGYRFMVTHMGKDSSGAPISMKRALDMDRHQSFEKSVINARPPFKDTVSIPSQGYAVVRFRATNPGFWLMHCHYDWHFANGMGLILQVGETSEMIKPPADFPKCSNYVPPLLVPTSNFPTLPM